MINYGASTRAEVHLTGRFSISEQREYCDTASDNRGDWVTARIALRCCIQIAWTCRYSLEIDENRRNSKDSDKIAYPADASPKIISICLI